MILATLGKWEAISKILDSCEFHECFYLAWEDIGHQSNTHLFFRQQACVCEALLWHYASCLLLGGVWEELGSLKYTCLLCRADDSPDCSGRTQHVYLWQQANLHFSTAPQTNKHKNNFDVILTDNNVLQYMLLLGNVVGTSVETLWMGTV